MAWTTTMLVVVLLALAAAVAQQHTGSPTPFAASSTAATNRGRGARRASVGRGGGSRPRGTTPSSPAPTLSTTSAFATTSRQQPAILGPTFPPTFTPTLSTFPTTPYPQQPQQHAVSRSPTTSPVRDVAVTPRRPSAPLGFGPAGNAGLGFASGFRPTSQPISLPFAGHRSPSSPALSPRPKATATPIVALKFNLRDDGSYSTSSETGDGTIRQEQGQFNGAGMAVQGMYAYRDSKVGPVQVNYVADEYGFQPQGPNIHPAIMQAVAEQVEAARSAKSRKGGKGVNSVLPEDDEGLLDYDNDNGAGTVPRQPNSDQGLCEEFLSEGSESFIRDLINLL